MNQLQQMQNAMNPAAVKEYHRNELQKRIEALKSQLDRLDKEL